MTIIRAIWFLKTSVIIVFSNEYIFVVSVWTKLPQKRRLILMTIY